MTGMSFASAVSGAGTRIRPHCPNRGAAARDWDGVHLSFGGLLTAELARFESAKGWTMLDTARAELTYWLRPQETEIERMADCREGTVARREGFDPRFPDIWGISARLWGR